MIESINGKTPRVDPSAFVAPGAVVIGDVELGPEASVWYQSVLRGDINWIRIGARSSIQDGTVIHVAHRGDGATVGSEVVVGHRVVLHGCVVEDGCLIGMGAVVLDRAVIGAGSIVAAGAVVPPGMKVPPGTLVAGVPAKVRRELDPEDFERTKGAMNRYRRVARLHADPSLTIDFSQE